MFDSLRRWLRARPAAAVHQAFPEAVHTAALPANPVGGACVVIDVRAAHEFRTIALETAINLPLPDLARVIQVHVADTQTPLILYCASGGRSGAGCKLLAQMGYTNVTNAGGLYAAAEKLRLPLRP